MVKVNFKIFIHILKQVIIFCSETAPYPGVWSGGSLCLCALLRCLQAEISGQGREGVEDLPGDSRQGPPSLRVHPEPNFKEGAQN